MIPTRSSCSVPVPAATLAKIPTRSLDRDLLIVKETASRPLDRMREVYKAVYSPRHYLALDPLVFTPGELAQKLGARDYLIQEIIREGKVLYERA